MKKIILSLAILFATSMTLIAAPASQNPTSESSDKAKKEMKHNKKDGRKDHMKAATPRFGNPFEGIELTAEQQTQIEELQKSLRPEKREGADKEKLSDEQKKELRKEMAFSRENIKAKYLEGVKNILTPEQYVKFLENNYLQSATNGDPRLSRNKGMDARVKKAPIITTTEN